MTMTYETSEQPVPTSGTRANSSTSSLSCEPFQAGRLPQAKLLRVPSLLNVDVCHALHKQVSDNDSPLSLAARGVRMAAHVIARECRPETLRVSLLHLRLTGDRACKLLRLIG